MQTVVLATLRKPWYIPRMKASFNLVAFPPAEAERITGLSTTQQRDWRRREIIPSNEGHARYDAFAVAEMWSLKLLSDRGIGPQAAKEVAPWCASGIVWHALRWRDAFDVDENLIPVPNQEWSFKASWLINGVWNASGRPRVVAAPYFIWWADGSHLFTPLLDDAFEKMPVGDVRVTGPVVILDLEALGNTLIERRHPLARVTFDT